MSDTTVLVVTGGHPFQAEPFFDVFRAIVPGRWRHAPQPDAQDVLNPEGCADVDVVVFYDMPGITFTRSDPPTVFHPPTPGFVDGFERLLDTGKGLVFLHHAIASWPAWERYAEIVGGRFHYQPMTLRGAEYPDSGYRFDVTHSVEVLEPTHPICDGLGEHFELTDELYCAPVFEDDVVPLLRTTYSVDDPTQFFSADAAIRGRRNTNEGWTHPGGSALVGWIKNAGACPVAYLQFGDGPVTYADANFRRVLANAMTWTASDPARAWARDRRSES